MLLEHADPPWRVALDDELLVVDVRVGVRPVFAQYGVDNSQQLPEAAVESVSAPPASADAPSRRIGIGLILGQFLMIPFLP